MWPQDVFFPRIFWKNTVVYTPRLNVQSSIAKSRKIYSVRVKFTRREQVTYPKVRRGCCINSSIPELWLSVFFFIRTFITYEMKKFKISSAKPTVSFESRPPIFYRKYLHEKTFTECECKKIIIFEWYRTVVWFRKTSVESATCCVPIDVHFNRIKFHYVIIRQKFVEILYGRSNFEKRLFPVQNISNGTPRLIKWNLNVLLN